MNWKYRQWVNTGWSDAGLVNYIGMEIYPEDIEVFSKILFPTLVEYKNCILATATEQPIEKTYKDFDDLVKNFGLHDAEKLYNWIRLNDLFLNTSEKTSPETFQAIANLMSKTWGYILAENFPKKSFEIVISGEKFDPEITFYQIRS